MTEYPPEIDELYPFSTSNNARSIVLRALQRFKECPCDWHAKWVEAFGITVDHDDADYGTGARGEIIN